MTQAADTTVANTLLEKIEALILQARGGQITENDALVRIASLTADAGATAPIYQKPLG